MTDILSRLAGLSFEHSSIPDAKEYIRRGFGFTAPGGERRWHLCDEEMNALTTAFRLRDDACRSLIALMTEAAEEIGRLSKRELVAVDDMDFEIAIAEAIQLMPSRTAYEDKGVPVLQYLKQHGYMVMQSKSDADAITKALNSIEDGSADG